jgi:hypothetical protein
LRHPTAAAKAVKCCYCIWHFPQKWKCERKKKKLSMIETMPREREEGEYRRQQVMFFVPKAMRIFTFLSYNVSIVFYFYSLLKLSMIIAHDSQ